MLSPVCTHLPIYSYTSDSLASCTNLLSSNIQSEVLHELPEIEPNSPGSKVPELRASAGSPAVLQRHPKNIFQPKHTPNQRELPGKFEHHSLIVRLRVGRSGVLVLLVRGEFWIPRCVGGTHFGCYSDWIARLVSYIRHFAHKNGRIEGEESRNFFFINGDEWRTRGSISFQCTVD